MEFRKGDALCFECDGGPLGLGISSFQELDGFLKDYANLPINPASITHIGFVINNNQYAESSLFGKRILPISKLKGKKVWHCMLKEELRDKIIAQEAMFDKLVNQEIGKRYDFEQIYKYALSILSLGLWEPKNDDRYDVCSEWYHRLLRQFGIKGKEENSSVVTPADIFAEDWYFDRRRLYV